MSDPSQNLARIYFVFLNLVGREEIEKNKRAAGKSLARPVRKQANVSVRMA